MNASPSGIVSMSVISLMIRKFNYAELPFYLSMAQTNQSRSEQDTAKNFCLTKKVQLRRGFAETRPTNPNPPQTRNIIKTTEPHRQLQRLVRIGYMLP